MYNIPTCLQTNIIPVKGKKPKSRKWTEQSAKISTIIGQIEKGTTSGIGLRTGRIARTDAAIICLNFNNSMELLGSFGSGMRVFSPSLNSIKVVLYLENEQEIYELLEIDDEDEPIIEIPTVKGKVEILKGQKAQAVIYGEYWDDKSGISLGEYKTKGDPEEYDTDELIGLIKALLSLRDVGKKIKYLQDSLDKLGENSGIKPERIISGIKSYLDSDEGFNVAKRCFNALDKETWDELEADPQYDPVLVLADLMEKPKSIEHSYSPNVLAMKCLEVQLTPSCYSRVFKEYFGNQLVYDEVFQEFLLYDGGIFTEKIDTQIKQIIRDTLYIVDEELGKRQMAPTDRKFLNELFAYLKEDTVGKLCPSTSRKNLIPMKDGVLSLRGDKPEIIPHSPDYGFTFKLPYNYDSSATCPEWLKFLDFALEGEFKQENIALLRAFLLMVVLWRKGHDRFLEIIGKPGTGKSTIANVFTALVGTPNTFSTGISDLEGGKFSAAEFVEKTLIVVREVDKWKKPTERLQSITSSDAIKTERKTKQKMPSKVCLANFLMCGNEPVYSSDVTGALNRRRLTIYCDNVKPLEQKVMLLENVANTEEWHGVFANELPGIFNWVISQDIESAYLMVKNGSLLASQKSATHEVLKGGSAVEQFVTSCIIPNKNSSMAVGKARTKRHLNRADASNSTRAGEVDTPLYHYFQAFCYLNKITSYHQPRQFRKALEATLKAMGINYSYHRNSDGYRFFYIGVNDEAKENLKLWLSKE